MSAGTCVQTQAWIISNKERLPFEKDLHHYMVVQEVILSSPAMRRNLTRTRFVAVADSSARLLYFWRGATTTMQLAGSEPGREGAAAGGLNHRATGASAF